MHRSLGTEDAGNVAMAQVSVASRGRTHSLRPDWACWEEPKMQNLNLILVKHQTNPDQGHSEKEVGCGPQTCQRRKRRQSSRNARTKGSAVSDSTRAVGQTGTRPVDQTTAFQRRRFPAFPLLSDPCGHVTSLFVERTC